MALLAISAASAEAQSRPSWPGDSWETSTPGEEGIDPEAVRALVEGVDALARPFFDSCRPFPTDRRKEPITIEDLLTTRSGIR